MNQTVAFLLVAVINLLLGGIIGYLMNLADVRLVSEELKDRDDEVKRYAAEAAASRNAMAESIKRSEAYEQSVNRYRESVAKLAELNEMQKVCL
jgi:hypothetical protein